MRTVTFAGLIILLSWLYSCKKNIDLPFPIDNCVAGQGGNITMILNPEHHGDPIVSTAWYPDSAFIKFNASDFPGEDPLVYDLVLTGNTGDDFITVNGLSCGKYFIFMTGFDPSIAERVKGGIPVTINENDSVLDLVIPVTED